MVRTREQRLEVVQLVEELVRPHAHGLLFQPIGINVGGWLTRNILQLCLQLEKNGGPMEISAGVEEDSIFILTADLPLLRARRVYEILDECYEPESM